MLILWPSGTFSARWRIANGAGQQPWARWKGANQATAASKAGAQVHFVAKVGKDQFSHLAADHLTRSDIHSLRFISLRVNQPVMRLFMFLRKMAKI
jgi:sugar/nucleoside kinase (ribokinase family)